MDCHPSGSSSILGAREKDIFASQNSQPIKLQHGTPEAVTFLARFRDYKQFSCGWFKAEKRFVDSNPKSGQNVQKLQLGGILNPLKFLLMFPLLSWN